MNEIKEYQNELNAIEQRKRTLRIFGGIILLIWLPIIIYDFWITWGYIQKYGFNEGMIRSIGNPIVIFSWILFLIAIPIFLSFKSNESKEKELKEKINKTKYCSECNKAISSDFNLCPYCGKNFLESKNV